MIEPLPDESSSAMLTLPTLAALLERYEAMAEAARANDWERLSALEREAAALREAARGNTSGAMDDAAALAKLPPADAAERREGIARLLALDAEIRSHTDPFLSSVRKLLSAGRQERALRDAYGASSR
ncbi:flagellar protein FliT [Thauera aminoaromatica]|uniref:flagellar protein FliT n=1 Tax=Thauera aminoaromatica TaxID=164330 RepID=UPI0035B01316